MSGPNFPRVKLTDIPGLIQAPDELNELTRKCMDDHVKHNKDSLFLMVVDATLPLSTSPVWDIVINNDIAHRTLGILTCCDILCEQSPDKFPELVEFVQGHSLVGEEQKLFDTLPNGWCMTMQKPLEGGEGVMDSRLVLEAQAVHEQEFFTTVATSSTGGKFPTVNCKSLVDKNRATVNGLKSQLTRMSKDVFKDVVPAKIEELRIIREQVYEVLASYGSPAAHFQYVKRDRIALAKDIVSKVKSSLDVNCAAERLNFRSSLLHDFDRELTSARHAFMVDSASISLDGLEKKICTGVAALKSSLQNHLNLVLDEAPWTKITDLVTMDNGPVNLKRFPQLREPVTHLVRHAYTEAIEAVRENMAVFLDSKRQHPRNVTWNYSMFRWTTDIQADSVTLTWDPSFHEDFITLVAVSLSQYVSSNLSDALAVKIEEVLTADSTEACAESRIKTLQIINLLDSTVGDLKKIVRFADVVKLQQIGDMTDASDGIDQFGGGGRGGDY